MSPDEPAAAQDTDAPARSVVVPAWREEDRIADCLARLRDHLDDGPPFEVIVSDDGSDDDTAERAREAAGDDPRLHVVTGPHAGKGAAVARGIAASRGTAVAWLDADLSAPPAALDVLLPPVERGEADLVVGSRRVPGGAPSVPQPIHRRLLGRGFTVLARTLVGIGDVRDPMCGAKAMGGDLARAWVADLHSRGFAFDIEILGRAARAAGADVRVAEVAVPWRDSPRSSVRVWRAVPAAFRDLLRARRGATARDEG